ncbi:uncharacterized protein LOC121969122 [Zingiber officinale]|uniref:uncharacterized protein LOC121969122 n=1 Tax=Zingiber officinale TaxID=94328 RepID=UPI001C4DB07B|nr:uncharacterized protein LOC121969122 [Zingiber officinale]
MKAPQNLKEAQKLWDEECTRAFEELKKYLETFPSLFKPITGEPLWVYLSATPEVVGVVLVKKQDNLQRLVYFFSHLLKGVESRYTALEKLIYGLMLMARRLRPYFLAYPITVLTNSSMGKALTNVEVAGMLIKWVTELGEYNIAYQPRTTIKAQALADFLTEIHQTDSEETWKVYVDGSSTQQGSGVEVLLISPQEDILQLAVRLNFRATNNEAEYEALLAGLQVARHVGDTRVIIYSDSQLVTQQVAGNFGINSDKLQRAPMINYLQRGILPTDLEEARLVRKKAHAYTMIEDQLYKRAFSRPLLKCLNMEEAGHALQEIHQRCCGNQAGGGTLARWVLLAGYFWPTLQKDALQQAFTSVAYPQSNGQTKVINREIVRGLKVKLDHVGGDWVDELQSIIWTHRTTPRESTSLTPFHLVYDNEAMVPIEIRMPSTRRMLYDEENVERRLAELDLISEIRERTVARLEAYRQRMKQSYDRRVVPHLFGEGDLVWKRVKPVGDVVKLAPQWDESYKVIRKLASGAYYLQDNRGRNLNRPWSANYLRSYRT